MYLRVRLLYVLLSFGSLLIPACQGVRLGKGTSEASLAPRIVHFGIGRGSPYVPRGGPERVIRDPNLMSAPTSPARAETLPQQACAEPIPGSVVTEPAGPALINTRPELEPLPTMAAVSTPESQHPLVWALEAFLEDRPSEAMKYLQAYAPKDQELVLRLLPIVAQAAKGGAEADRPSPEELRALIGSLQSLLAELQASAPLVIDKLVFCRRVRGFGQFERLPTNQFRPGDQVYLYAELHNLADRRIKDQYLTHLASTLEIRTADCRVVRTLPVQSVPDRSESFRTDHFTVIRFPIPADLQPGIYDLRVRIMDQETHREAVQFLSFRIAGPSSQTAAAKGR